MQIEITPEVMLSQLGFSHSEHAIKQMQQILKNTKNIETFGKHIFALNGQLKHMHAHIAPSNSNNYLKIKLDEEVVADEIIEEFHENIKHWSKKYKIKIKKVNKRETYYIIGTKSKY